MIHLAIDIGLRLFIVDDRVGISFLDFLYVLMFSQFDLGNSDIIEIICIPLILTSYPALLNKNTPAVRVKPHSTTELFCKRLRLFGLDNRSFHHSRNGLDYRILESNLLI